MALVPGVSCVGLFTFTCLGGGRETCIGVWRPCRNAAIDHTRVRRLSDFIDRCYRHYGACRFARS